MGHKTMLINAGNLLRHEGGVADIVVNARYTKVDNWNVIAQVVEQRLGSHLRLRISPTWINRRVFVYEKARTLFCLVHQHCTGEDELRHLEGLQPIYEPPGPLDRNLFVERIGLARNVIVGRKVNHRSNAVTETGTHLLKCSINLFLGGEVKIHYLGRGRRFRRARSVERNYGVLLGEALDKFASDEPGRTGEKNYFAEHADLP